MSFETQIKSWVTLDSEIRNENEKLKKLREKRKLLCNEIYEYVNDNELNNAVVNISDGRLKFVQTKTTNQYTLKYIKECLSHFIEDESSIQSIIKYMKDNREVKYSEEIKRTFN
jgi:hypothetical protein